MTPSANDAGEQATDKLLFQYLEGELTDEQTHTLEARLAADPALRSELELWQATFVTPDDCDTAALETGLLQEPVPPAGVPFSRWGAGLVLVAALFLTSFLTMFLLCERSLLAEQRPHLPPAAEKAAAPAPVTHAIMPRVPAPDPAPQPVIVAAPERVISGNKTFSPNREDRPPVAAPVLAAAPMPVVVPREPVITLQAIPPPEGVGLGYAKEQPVKKVKVPVVRTLSRKQQRAVARLKRRAVQQRKANEFLKGNVPYVVPLNSNNF